MSANTSPRPRDAAACEIDMLESIRRIIRGYDVHSRRLLSSSTVTLAQLLCLRILRDSGPSTARQLATSIHISASTMVGILDRLEAKTLIERRRDRGDRRRVVVAITPAGEAVAAGCPPPLGPRFLRHLRRLDPAGREALAAPLRRVADLIAPDSDRAA